MGSGSSAKRGSTESSKYKPAAEVSPIHAPDTSGTDDRENGCVRPCDKCGETRKLSQLGESAQWLCVACQLSSGARPGPRPIKSIGDSKDHLIAPQPQLKRSATVNIANTQGNSSRMRRQSTEVEHIGIPPSPSAQDMSSKKARRRAKGLAPEQPDMSKRVSSPVEKRSSAPSSASLRRAQTVTMNDLKLDSRNNYRSSAGLRDLKEQMGVPGSVQEDPVTSVSLQQDERISPSTQKDPAPLPKKKLAGGYSVGDRVQSLISRLRGGLLVLELGHEGTVMGVALKGGPASSSEDDIRVLIQFKPGFDWLLPLRQICPASAYQSTRAAGLPGGFAWGVKIRSLITYLKPAGAKKEVWLGDAGTVVGPGLIKGKIAIRFEDGRGEWSVWPATVCLADAYDKAVSEKLPGGCCRGDRVRARGQCKGVRSCGPKENKFSLKDGEEGTVVGPGHTSGYVLVHFDSDERVWSLSEKQIEPESSAF